MNTNLDSQITKVFHDQEKKRTAVDTNNTCTVNDKSYNHYVINNHKLAGNRSIERYLYKLKCLFQIGNATHRIEFISSITTGKILWLVFIHFSS